MTLTKQEFAHYIRQFSFRELFNDMGWNNDKTKQPIIVDNLTFTLQAVAQKSGFKILLCPPLPTGQIPDYNTRKKIETKVTKLFQEHLIIFGDAKQQEQIWQLVTRQTGQPTKVTETRYHIAQDPQLLYQRASGLFFELDEEEKITIVDVTQRVAANFQQNNEKVTKQFYDRFKKEHTAFLGFIKGIDDRVNQDWYASLMLNRLMFCYFIQKKGFLDNNKDYLRDKLNACRSKKGQNKFYSFYRHFLLALFHHGLGAPQHSPELTAEIGRIPYLNGGLFEAHELEKQYQAIDIDDRAFESIFNFFDQYEWHLDTRLTASGKDINPDVIGYIFEKYINDRAQMGAYYTKEDITEYISKNCLLPYLFDETKRRYPKAFAPEGEIWQMVKNSGDDYIYEAVKHGINEKPHRFSRSVPMRFEPDWSDLPDEIRAGLKVEEESERPEERPYRFSKPITSEEEKPHRFQKPMRFDDLTEKRKVWNQPAPPEIALPTEIYREVIDRRRRYAETCQKIESGQITHINDFITHNLNIRQFAQDVIENSTDPDLLKHFYQALTGVTILDPTAGSGAFLFAAMNILEPLYEACLQRMENFVREAPKGKFKFFEETLAQVKAPEHPNLPYFVYKSIILRNLYGVDIMKEAVEIAKLRLFLKLVATVEADYRRPNLGLEPLPDVDFNIRAGNTLIGFATEAELNGALSYTMDGLLAKPVITEKMEIVARAFQRFKEIQLTQPSLNQAEANGPGSFKQAKAELNQRLQELNHQLNQLLYQRANALDYDQWLGTHQPFHWFAEFYEIIHNRGGFDVIIGNPPYVEYPEVKKTYTVTNYETISTNNLYAFVSERSKNLLHFQGRMGLILPNSSVSAGKMKELQRVLEKKSICWISNFAWRPSKLFDGANMLLAIWIVHNTQKNNLCYSTRYHRWPAEFREALFSTIEYTDVTNILIESRIPKSPGIIAHSIFDKCQQTSKGKTLLHNFNSKTGRYSLFYFRAVLYWFKVLISPPIFKEDGVSKQTGEMKEIVFANVKERDVTLALLSSNLFSFYYTVWSSCQVVNSSDFTFPVDIGLLLQEKGDEISKLAQALIEDYKANSEIRERHYSAKGRNFIMHKQYFYLKKSKAIIDEIDRVLAEHYGFTAEELDFIINYDIKYRMGKELEAEEG